MPTFRGNVHSDFDLFLQYGFNIKKLDDFLTRHHMQLEIKLHPFNRPSKRVEKELCSSRRIRFLDQAAIYETLHHYDILITDYSSVFFDYLLLDRPIIFAPFDKESYLEKEREFYFDYDKITPGPKAKDWDEILKWLEIFDKNPSLYSVERKTIKRRFHTHEDTHSTQRVYQSILKLLS